MKNTKQQTKINYKILAVFIWTFQYFWPYQENFRRVAHVQSDS